MTEATATKEAPATTENAELIAELLANAKTVGRGNNPVINRGDDENPAPMVMTVEDKGLVWLYEITTGRSLRVLEYLLPVLLKATNPDGSRRFSTIKPKVTPPQGTLKCPLHPDGPNRAHYDEMGLPSCRKANLTSPYMAERHCKSRHPSAWAVIEKERQDAEKQEERDFQRSLMTMGRAQTQGQPAAPKKTWSRQPKNKRKSKAPEAKAPA